MALSALRLASRVAGRRVCRHAVPVPRFLVTASDASPTGPDPAARTTHFGYQTVREEEKVERVGQVFRQVADSYDLMNDLMSGTLHRMWKDEFIASVGPLAPSKDGKPVVCLDVAGGTGDIAFRLAAALRSSLLRPIPPRPTPDGAPAPPHPAPTVIVSDINPAMLQVGKQRAAALGLTDSRDPEAPVLAWLEANAESLPLADNSVDLYTIAFGIRNVTHIDVALREAHRVLRPGGRFMCLEFSRVTNPLLRAAYDTYSFNVIPAMGEVVAGNRSAYQYLVESIRNFPDQDTFCSMIAAAGFSHVRYNNYTFGVVAQHTGFKF